MLWSYELPADRIALYPLAQRDAARLLVYAQGRITEGRFRQLAEFLPSDTLVLYNDSRVIPARLRQGKSEVLITEIVEGGWEKGGPQRWRGLFRPARFWRRGGYLQWAAEGSLTLTLSWEGPAPEGQGFFQAEWQPAELTAIQVLEKVGEMPIPPYLKRPAEALDKERYQTLHGVVPGSIAAPTAGLHFTEAVWASLAQKGIRRYPITLHVGPGTFLPLREPERPEAHTMHAEWFSVSAETLEALRTTQGPVVCVGTTTLRVVESLYWLGMLALRGTRPAVLPQFVWEDPGPLPAPRVALEALRPPLSGHTALYILPGYPFQIAHGLITNFHQPGSTLLALVEAFIGRAAIEAVYTYALKAGFRFLSYGDTSLLWRV